MRTFFLSLSVYLLAGTCLVFGASSDKALLKFPFLGRVISERVHVRAGQSNNYESVAMVNKDSELLVLGKQYSWYKVGLPEGATIYIKNDCAKLLSPEVGEVTVDRLNVRVRPSTEASIVGQLSKGEQFVIKGRAGEKSDWYLIRPSVKTVGWVQESFLEFKSAAVAGKDYSKSPGVSVKPKTDQDGQESPLKVNKYKNIKVVGDNQYEALGVIVPVVKLGIVSYKLMGGPKADSCIAYLAGSSSVLESFVGSRVVVRGAVSDDPTLDALTMKVSKITLSL